MEDRIRELAFLKWEAAGCPPGDGVNFWCEAEAELSDGVPCNASPPKKKEKQVAAAVTTPQN